MNKLFIAGGVAAIAIAAKLAYQKFFNPPKIIPKQVVLKKLIDMKQYLYPVLFEIANIVATKLTPQGVPPDQAKMFIMQSDQLDLVAFKQNIATILNQKVYFDMDEETLQHAIEDTYKDDKQVQFYKKQFKEQYQKCFLGIQPQALSTRMLILNKQTILQIISQLLESKIYILKLKDKLNKLRNIVQLYQQEMSKRKQLNEEKAMQGFEMFLMKDENQDDRERHQILKKYKIEDVKTFQFAIAKFIKQSLDFKTNYEKLQVDFKQNVFMLLSKCQ